MKTNQSASNINPLRSMTFRLPAMYALIATIVVLVLGLVLYGSLRWYYGQQERDYLVGVAQPINRALQRILPSDNPMLLQGQMSLFSFLARAQVDILDADNEVIVSASTFDPEPFFDRANNSNSFFVESAQVDGDLGFDYLLISPSDTNNVVTIDQSGEIIIQPSDETVTLNFDSIPSALINDVMPAFNTEDQPILRAFNQYRQSSTVVHSVPIYSTSDEFLATLRLSNGPAYGGQIIEGVMVGWLIASAVSIGLAMILGWIASRDVINPLRTLSQTTQQMAKGDLSARVGLARDDEFGVLSTSFDEMAQQIEDTVRTLKQFVSDAAHELNTPITALRTNIELIPPLDDSHYVERALQQIQRLEDLTQNLLQLSRLESDFEVLSVNRIDMGQLVQQVAQLHASQAEQAQVSLTIHIGEEPLYIIGNETKLHQAVSNLVHNAIKFTAPTGDIWISLQGLPASVHLTIEDTGIGLPEDDIPFLFHRFHRGRNTARYAGSGLGLAIVAAIINQYDGTIIANNTDEGAQFVIHLPKST